MPQQPKRYIKVQRIPDAKRARRPSKDDIHNHPDSDTLVEIMSDSLLASMAEHQGQTWDLLHEADDPEAFLPVPGRCLWTWEDLIQADPESVDLTPLLNLSLRPSHFFKEHLQSVTPRFCKLLTGMRYSELGRALNWLNDQGILPTRSDKDDVIKSLTLQGYGRLIDAEVDLTATVRTWSAPRNSRMTAAQHYALTYGPPQASLAEATLIAPPTPADLLPDLDSRFNRAADFLTERAREAPLPDLEDDEIALETINYVRSHTLDHLRHPVQERYLRGTWDTYRMGDSTLSVEERTQAALLRAMVQIDKRRRPIHLNAALGGAILAGISPASLVREAMHVLSRTGTSFLSEKHILDMIDQIRILPRARSPQAQGNREDLISELNHLLIDFQTTRDKLNPSLSDDIWRAQHSISVPSWGLMGELD